MAARRPRTPAHEVTIVNPTKKRKRKAPKKAGKKKAPMAKRRRRRKTTTTAPAPRRRRRRTKRNPISTRTRARVKHATRRGKFLGGFVLDPAAPLQGMLARLAGKVATAWTVRRWGGPGTVPVSVTTGQAWTFKGYFIALLTGYLGGELVARAIGEGPAKEFYQGSLDMTATKLMWTELIQRWDMAKEALGQDDAYQAQLDEMAMGATEGDILDDGDGNRWLLQDGRWVSMQGGEMGQLVAADYLGADDDDDDDDGDGYEDEDDETPAAGMGQLVAADYLGHMMPAATAEPDAAPAQYLRRGSPDPYAAIYY